MHTTGQMTICVLILLLTSVGLAADEREPIELGQYRQLFVDDYVIGKLKWPLGNNRLEGSIRQDFLKRILGPRHDP